jgi:hypothetical protein
MELDLIGSVGPVSEADDGELMRVVIRINVHLVLVTLRLGVSKLLSVIPYLIDKVDEIAVAVGDVSRPCLLPVAEVFNGGLDASDCRETEVEVEFSNLGPLL